MRILFRIALLALTLVSNAAHASYYPADSCDLQIAGRSDRGEGRGGGGDGGG